MPTIDPDLVPTVAPGTLFRHLTQDTNLLIRWFTAGDPVYFEVLNRVPADIALRQLIIAKTLDQLNLRLGHEALFPYLVQPQIVNGTTLVDVPLSLVWDMHVSLPLKWEKVRLARIKRLSGVNNGTGGGSEFTGYLRLVFTAQEQGSSTEAGVFYADVQIDSNLLYQVVRVSAATTTEFNPALDSGETSTVGGFIIFRTLDESDPVNELFLDAVAPPTGGTIGTDGEFTTPSSYEVADTIAGGTNVTDDFSSTAMTHGTGALTAAAWVPVPDLNSDIQTIINTLNYPFGVEATRVSITSPTITIPKGLFREFSLTAPGGDEASGDVTGTLFPVWINRVVREDVSSDNLTLYFATHQVATPASTVPIEFAKLALARSYVAGQVVNIEPAGNLFGITGDVANWQQEFGRGHVVLSSLWGGTSSEVTDFFDAFIPVIDDPAEVFFSKVTARLSSWGLDRFSKLSPTKGQSDAMRGSRAGVSDPTASNRFVVEGDQGRGDRIDFSVNTTLPANKRENTYIERYGYTGSLVHHLVYMVVDAAGSLDYTTDVLPRLRILLGRDPVFGDEWFDGTRFKKFNGDVWIG